VCQALRVRQPAGHARKIGNTILNSGRLRGPKNITSQARGVQPILPASYFLWGYLKYRAYANNPKLDAIKTNIRTEIMRIRRILHEMLDRVITNFATRSLDRAHYKLLSCMCSQNGGVQREKLTPHKTCVSVMQAYERKLQSISSNTNC